MTEEEVIEFEKNNKDNYIEPKEWSSVDDIIQGKQLILHSVSKRYYHEVCGKGTLIKEYEHSVYGTMLMVKPLKQKDIYFAPKREFTELPFS